MKHDDREVQVEHLVELLGRIERTTTGFMDEIGIEDPIDRRGCIMMAIALYIESCERVEIRGFRNQFLTALPLASKMLDAIEGGAH